MRLSIIMPAYKVASYIEKCIRSLENKDLSKDDFEIIIINDGSPDRCREIVETLQQEFSNIVLINQENQGVSMARNNGIAAAKGKYILPIDPDDYVIPNTIKRILDLADSKLTDVMYLGFEIFDETGKSEWETNYTKQENEIYQGLDGYYAARGLKVRDPDRSWALLYKKSMLDKFAIRYPKDVPYLEDGLFIAKVFLVAERVGFDNTIFYQRTTREGSATNSQLFFSDKAIHGFIKAVKDVKDFATKNNLNSAQVELVNHTVTKYVILALSPSVTNFNFKQYFKVISLLKKANLEKLNTEGLQTIYLKYAKIYNASKLLLPFYIRLLNRYYHRLRKTAVFTSV